MRPSNWSISRKPVAVSRSCRGDWSCSIASGRRSQRLNFPWSSNTARPWVATAFSSNRRSDCTLVSGIDFSDGLAPKRRAKVRSGVARTSAISPTVKSSRAARSRIWCCASAGCKPARTWLINCTSDAGVSGIAKGGRVAGATKRLPGCAPGGCPPTTGATELPVTKLFIGVLARWMPDVSKVTAILLNATWVPPIKFEDLPYAGRTGRFASISCVRNSWSDCSRPTGYTCGLR